MKFDPYQFALAIFSMSAIVLVILKGIQAHFNAKVEMAKVNADKEVQKAKETSAGITAIAGIIERLTHLEKEMNEIKQNYIRLLERMADKYRN